MLFSTLLGAALMLPAIASQEQMHARVIALYDFHPHTLSDAERATKSAAMDAFWTDVKAEPATTLPLLRAELRRSDTPAFFAVDGSALLQDMSHTREDLTLVAATLPRADLDDVAANSYFYSVHALASQGIDVTAASLHMLDSKNFVFLVPQHAMTLHLPESLVLTLGLLPTDVWFQAASDRFEHATDDGRRSLLFLCFFAQTDGCDALLLKASQNAPLAEDVRAEAANYLAIEKDALKAKVSVPGALEEIRAQRAKRLAAVSDEALDEAKEMTVRMIQLRHR